MATKKAATESDAEKPEKSKAKAAQKPKKPSASKAKKSSAKKTKKPSAKKPETPAANAEGGSEKAASETPDSRQPMGKAKRRMSRNR